MSFCEKCESLLDPVFTDGLQYNCSACGAIYDSKETDIIAEAYSGADVSLSRYKTPIQLAPFCPVDLKVRRTCSGCGNGIMAITRVGETLTSVYSCTCGKIEF